MIINTFSYLWSSTAIDAIAELADNGYQTFEVPISSPHCWPEEISTSERSANRLRIVNSIRCSTGLPATAGSAWNFSWAHRSMSMFT